MSSTMYKNGVSKVFHNREIAEAKKAGWTFDPVKVVKAKPIKKSYDLKIGEVQIKHPKPTDLSGPEDLDKSGE